MNLTSLILKAEWERAQRQNSNTSSKPRQRIEWSWEDWTGKLQSEQPEESKDMPGEQGCVVLSLICGCITWSTQHTTESDWWISHRCTEGEELRNSPRKMKSRNKKTGNTGLVVGCFGSAAWEGWSSGFKGSVSLGLVNAACPLV